MGKHLAKFAQNEAHTHSKSKKGSQIIYSPERGGWRILLLLSLVTKEFYLPP